jgi:hypothetical protein
MKTTPDGSLVRHLAPESEVMVCKVGSAEIARAFPVQ